MARVVFMGTPEFALPSLQRLDSDYEVVGVVTQPDRPAGRGRDLQPSPVKVLALRLGLPVITPDTLLGGQVLAQLESWAPDVIVVAAFGQILRQDVLELPAHGCLNVHASLLPRWRGGAPIAAAILAGDQVTGVTVMRMDVGLDTGPILAQREERVRSDDTRASLGRRLSVLGASLLAETLGRHLAGEVAERPQPEEGVTFAPQLRKKDGRLDWAAGAVELDRRVRAFTPWPGTFTFWKGKRLRILGASPLTQWEGGLPPGVVFEAEQGPAVATGAGALRLDHLQLAGRRPLPGPDFVRGQRGFVGSRLGGGES
jgi:methionyl-tRNA formyltransferase